jgi:5'-3' exonuclease
VRVFLLDGTYELFRHHFALPSSSDDRGREVAAVKGVLASVLSLLGEGVTHLAVATDHVIESWRNQAWPGYKSSEGVAPELLAQFGLLEEALQAMGVLVWPMVEYEADDALAAAAAHLAQDGHVDQVVICTPDKDLNQCVRGATVVQYDRRKRVVIDEEAVRTRFGVGPASVPDWLALVGDSADGYPGLPGWGAKATTAVLARFEAIEAIPDAVEDWKINVRGAGALAATLARQRREALLFKRLATCGLPEAPVAGPEPLAWSGPTDAFAALCRQLGSGSLPARAERLVERRG